MSKEVNYTAAQEAVIQAAADANGGVLNLDAAKALAADERLNDKDGNPRGYRSVVAKIGRMGIAYERKQPTTKDGRPVTRKTDLVSRIAERAGVDAAVLAGMEASPKGALEALEAALAA